MPDAVLARETCRREPDRPDAAVDANIIRVRLAAAHGSINVDVVDHGIGVPSAERSRTFERFHRGPHEDRGGYGLGLYLVRHIMEAHGGRVEVSSASLAAETPFSRQTPSIGMLDLRVEKTIGLRHSARGWFGLYVDALNATNVGQAIAYTRSSGPPFGLPIQWTEPRTM